MADPEWLETARKKGLNITGHGVNLDFVAGAVPDRALATTTTAVNGQLAIQLFRQKCAAAKNEDAFQSALIEFGQFNEWLIAHFRPARVMVNGEETWRTPVAADGKGFLDLELARERLIKVECKYGRNGPTADQLKWLGAYARSGTECYVWYPRDCEEIIEVLTRRVPCLRPTTR